MIFDYDMLYNAWKNTVIQSSVELNRARFKYYLEWNLYTILFDLRNRTYIPTKLRTRIVTYPKRRIVQVPSIRDKIVQHSICDNYLSDILTKPLIKETCACIKERGTIYASNIVKEELHKYFRQYKTNKFYVLKCDIKSYFASIPHDKIKGLVDRYVKDYDVNLLVKRFIDIMPDEKGLALGLQQSQLLANIYLSDLDHKCKELLRCKFYGRYMDDFYIISNDLNFLNRCLSYIENYVKTIGLKLNPKTSIVKNKLEFLGFNYHLTESGKVIQSISKSKKITKHRQLNKMLDKITTGEITINQYLESYNGWRAHALQGNCRSLVNKWDKWIIDYFKNELNMKLKYNKKRRLECQEK